jgi:hypothetical protein
MTFRHFRLPFIALVAFVLPRTIGTTDIGKDVGEVAGRLTIHGTKGAIEDESP